MSTSITSAKYFLTAKDGAEPEDNADSAAAATQQGRFAISDGTSESGFSKIWSRLLVEHFVAHSAVEACHWSSWLPQAQAQWIDQLNDVYLPWYGEQQFQQGSFATFLSVVVYRDDDGSIRYFADAVGDSCLFHLRGGDLLQVFPIERAGDFDRLPDLIGSRWPVTEIETKRSRSTEASAKPRDRLLLMSDALAEWTLSRHEAGHPPWDEINDRLDCTPEEFTDWIAELRENHDLHNDDVALMVIDL